MEAFAAWLVDVIQAIGYPGIFAAMFLGNALVPVPVEAIMIPAGYLVEQKQMHLVTLLCCAIAGDLGGSLFAYFIAARLGRRVLVTYGKHLFFGQDKVDMLDRFFAKHGEISTLIGRLVPGLRHFMAFPAGLSHMNVEKFAIYTTIGGGVWTGVLIGIGYLIGGNKHLVRHYMPYIESIVIVLVIAMTVVYIIRHRKQKTESTNGGT